MEVDKVKNSLLAEDAVFVINLVNHMHTETNRITDDIIKRQEARILELETRNEILEDRLFYIKKKWNSFLGY